MQSRKNPIRNHDASFTITSQPKYPQFGTVSNVQHAFTHPCRSDEPARRRAGVGGAPSYQEALLGAGGGQRQTDGEQHHQPHVSAGTSSAQLTARRRSH